jgi:putative ABC transport system permease protein
MNFREAFVVAVSSLRVNRLRAALTTFGIVIGVSAVIVLVGLGDGIKAGFNELTYLTLFTVAIAAISLIVGGIGIANIMLVSVTERTKEIGIRKAIGARRSAIMKQFLLESTMLAGIGGLMGVAVGVVITVAATIVLPQVAPKFGTPDVSISAVLLAFLVSLLIGLVAGGYPAYRAATLRPIEALRYE